MAFLTGDSFIDCLLILVSGTLIFFNYIIKKYTVWSRINVYGKTPTFPYGNLGDVLFKNKTSIEFWNEQYIKLKKKGKNFGGYYSYMTPTLFVVNRNLIQKILVSDFECFKNRYEYSNDEVEPLANNLLQLKDKKWEELHRKLAPIFSLENIQKLTDTFDKFIDSINLPNGEINILEHMNKLTVSLIATSVFGIAHDDIKFHEVCEDTILEQGTFTTVLTTVNKVFPMLSKILKLNIYKKSLSNYCLNLVSEEIKNRKKNDILKKDLLQEFIHLMNSSENDSLTVEEVAAQAFVFIVAGRDTITTTLTLALYELANNQEIQNELRNEIKRAKEETGKVKYDELLYLEKVILETLRKYPSVPFITRHCKNLYKVPGENVTIPAGVEVIIPVFSIHRDSACYINPENFNPDRHNTDQRIHSGAYLPFGAGPRTCMGAKFSQLFIKICLSQIILNYKFTPSTENVNSLELDVEDISLICKDKVWLKVEKI